MRNYLTIIVAALIVFINSPVIAQVTIGVLTPPDASAVLQVIAPKSDKGVLVPALTEQQRNAIQTPADGLLIYNVDEECFNYYANVDFTWHSLCGGIAKAVFTVNSCSDIVVNGSYTVGNALDASNYLSVTVNVTKVGNYSFMATTSNGYGFTAQGTFLNTGIQTFIAMGQGKPVTANQSPGDPVRFSASGSTINCNAYNIIVMPPTAIYTLNCGSAKFNGTYVKGQALGANNTVTLSVNVSDISTGGSWTVSTNTVNGISFSGSGIFTTVGNQTITLQGSGTPTTLSPITLNFTTNSKDGAATCSATVNIAVSPKTIYALGAPGSTYGYDIATPNSAVNKMLTAANNYGTNDNSTVKFVQPFNFIDAGYPTDTRLLSDLGGSTPPDIVVIGYAYSGSNTTTVAQAFLDYLNKGGIIIMYCETTALVQGVMRTIFGDNTITASLGWGAGATYQLPIINDDPILNGPFGNVGSLYWGEDASQTVGLNISNTNAITVYSRGSGGNVTAFKHNSLNLLYVGDGGFVSNNGGTDMTICPFKTDANNVPIAKPTYGVLGLGNGIQPVINSIFTANAMAWAIQVAQTSGINSSRY